MNDLICNYNPISDLTPLTGMPLKRLYCAFSNVSDLTPLRSCPLTLLDCVHTPVADLSPLAKCPQMNSLNVKGTKVTASQVAALQKALPNCKIEWDEPDKPGAPEPAAAGKK